MSLLHPALADFKRYGERDFWLATPSGATTFNQNLTATSATTATFVRQAGKPFNATATSTSTVTKRVGKPVQATVTSTATIAAMKVILLAITATVTTIATIARKAGKLATATVTSTASIVKQVGKLLQATATSTATVTTIKMVLKAITATVTSTATIVRRTNLAVQATASVAASVAKRVGKTIAGLVSSLADLVGIKSTTGLPDTNPMRVVYTEATGDIRSHEPGHTSYSEPADVRGTD